MSVTCYRKAIAFNRRQANGVGRSDFELSIQRVVNDDSRLASVSSWATLIANLCSNTCEVGQTCHTVLAAGLSLIAQIIGELAPYGDCAQSPTGQWIAIDLATVASCLLDQSRLAYVLLRTQA